MTEEELQQQRREKWRVTGEERAVRTLEDARVFLQEVGFCLAFPARPAVLAPIFAAACLGSDQNLPDRGKALADKRMQAAQELMVRLLRERSAFEAQYEAGLPGGELPLLIGAAEFPYFYALVGERNPKSAPSGGMRGEKKLLPHVFEMIQKRGPLSKRKIREAMGDAVSEAAIDRALHELWQKLRLIRVDHSPAEGSTWDLLYRWAPEMVREGVRISTAEALSAAISKYLETVIAAEMKEIEDFFGRLASRSRVGEVVRALLSAREFSFLTVEGRTLIHITPAAPAPKPRPAGVGTDESQRKMPIRRRQPRG